MASFQEEQPVQWCQTLVVEHHILDLALTELPSLEEEEHLIEDPWILEPGVHLIEVRSVHHWSMGTGYKVLVQESTVQDQAVAMEVVVDVEDSVPCHQM